MQIIIVLNGDYIGQIIKPSDHTAPVCGQFLLLGKLSLLEMATILDKSGHNATFYDSKEVFIGCVPENSPP